MPSFRSIRLQSLLTGHGRRDIAARHCPAAARVRARRMDVGAGMLSMFGMDDDWLPTDGDFLAPYGSHVFELSEAIVLSASGIIGLQGGELIEDTLDHTDPRLDRYDFTSPDIVRFGQPQRRLAGRHLSLLLGNHTNHFHFLLMNLARMALLQPGELDGLDGILIPAGLGGAQHEALQLAQLARHAPLRGVERGESLQVEKLLLPWNVASGHGVNPVAVSWLRGLCPPVARDARTAGRRIYIDRRSSPLRRLLNEEEIVEMLRSERIEPVRMEELPLAEQALLMAQCELVVGPHGAGLTNIVFAEPGTRVIEIMPSGCVNWCYRHLAAACGQQYDCVVGRSYPQGDMSAAWASWVASPTHLLSAVRGARAFPR